MVNIWAELLLARLPPRQAWQIPVQLQKPAQPRKGNMEHMDNRQREGFTAPKISKPGKNILSIHQCHRAVLCHVPAGSPPATSPSNAHLSTRRAEDPSTPDVPKDLSTWGQVSHDSLGWLSEVGRRVQMAFMNIVVILMREAGKNMQARDSKQCGG